MLNVIFFNDRRVQSKTFKFRKSDELDFNNFTKKHFHEFKFSFEKEATNHFEEAFITKIRLWHTTLFDSPSIEYIR